MKSRRVRRAPRSRGGYQRRRSGRRIARRRPAVPGRFLTCLWADAGVESPAPRDAIPETAAPRRSDLESEINGNAIDWVDCPECGLPAYVLDRFVRPSTDGPLPHAITVCARMHRLCTTEDPAGQIDAG